MRQADFRKGEENSRQEYAAGFARALLGKKKSATGLHYPKKRSKFLV
jgi:hypothetical protein